LTAKKPSNKGPSHMLFPGNTQGTMARNIRENLVKQISVHLINQIPVKRANSGVGTLYVRFEFLEVLSIKP